MASSVKIAVAWPPRVQKRRLMLAREVKSLREQKKEMQKALDACKKRDEVMRKAL
jgi:hypothetical protein